MTRRRGHIPLHYPHNRDDLKTIVGTLMVACMLLIIAAGLWRPFAEEAEALDTATSTASLGSITENRPI
jgi:hypothetical protein